MSVKNVVQGITGLTVALRDPQRYPRVRSSVGGARFRRMQSCKMCLKTGLLGFSLSAVPIHGVAQSGAASIPVGDASLTPIVTLEYITTNNVFLTPDNKVSSYGVRVSPQLTLAARKGVTSFQLSYRGAYATFDENRLDYADHALSLGAAQGISKRLRVNGSLSLNRTHEELGTNQTTGLSSNFDEQITFNDYRANASLTYGAQGAFGNVRAGVSTRDRSQNNFDQQSGASFTSVEPFVEFSLRISPDTRVITGFEYSDVDYDVGTSRDRDVYTAFVGVSFSATGKLSGSARLGVSDVDFIDQSVNDTEEVVLDASLQYSPVDYSWFGISLVRDFDTDIQSLVDNSEEEVTDEDTITDRVRLGWRHEWSSRLFHEAGISYSNTSRDCPTDSYQTTRQNFSLNLYLKRWLIVGAGINADQRKGDLCVAGADSERLDYDRQRFVIRVRATL